MGESGMISIELGGVIPERKGDEKPVDPKELGLGTLPAYPKIYALGHLALRQEGNNLLDGAVTIQEKVDGSQFSFGVLNGELMIRSKGRGIYLEAPDKMFALGVEYVKTIQDKLVPNWIYRCEYLRIPKHNTLAYSRIPTNHLVLFDILTGVEQYATNLQYEADKIGIDAIPEFHCGEFKEADFQRFMERESYLGGQTVEGVVVKNYGRFCQKTGHVLLGKYVSEKFKEIHCGEWKKNNPTRKDIMEQLIDKYKTEARWEKAVYRLRDAGLLEHEPRDIGKLVASVWPDIKAECEDEIKQDLWNYFSKQLERAVVGGLAEWYKTRLAHEQFERSEDV
jgi:hypothetical protein